LDDVFGKRRVAAQRAGKCAQQRQQVKQPIAKFALMIFGVLRRTLPDLLIRLVDKDVSHDSRSAKSR
jgi:hypothetical protein